MSRFASLPLLASMASACIAPEMFCPPNYTLMPRKGEKRRRTGKIVRNRAKAKAARQARKRR